MNKPPTIDPAVWQFPCRVELKVVGDARADFAANLIAEFQRLIPGDYTYRSTPSSGGKYVSITVPVILQNAQQVQQLYAALRDVAGVKMVL